MIPGETVGAKTTKCRECNQTLIIKVCHSWGGYYIGFRCPNCGPYSRESDYYKTQKEAEEALKNGQHSRS